MTTRVGSFISSTLTLLVSVILTYIGYTLIRDLPVNGLQSLSLIVTIPIGLFIYVALCGLLISTLITTIKSIGSSVTAIKVVSIFYLILILADIVFVIIKSIELVKLF